MIGNGRVKDKLEKKIIASKGFLERKNSKMKIVTKLCINAMQLFLTKTHL